jgi:hypothetical protein
MYKKQIYYRLIALWVVCEAFMGGIIHGLKLPVSGLIVGGAAVICICLIAWYYPVRGAILRATIIVAIFKMMLSPQSPMPAYIAVFFQGLVAEAIFINKGSYRFNCLLFAILALVESGVQRLLVMTLVFGMDIWKAINIFINGITGEENITNYSYYLAAIYVLMHFIAGIAIGWFAGKIPNEEKAFFFERKFIIPWGEEENNIQPTPQKKKHTKWILIIIYIILAGLFIQSAVFPENAILPSNMIIKLILRSTLIIFSWVLIINPLLKGLLYRWLEKKKSAAGEEIKEITRLIPSMQSLIEKSWKLSAHKNILKRLALFAKIVVFNSLRYE